MRSRMVIMAVLALGLAGCAKSSPAAPADTPGATVIAIMSLDSSGSSYGDYDSNGKLVDGTPGSAFSPKTASVTAGSTVTWRNNDTVTHEPTSDTPGLFDSRIDPNGKFDFQLATPGTYTYHCSIHPDMTGTITVK